MKPPQSWNPSRPTPPTMWIKAPMSISRSLRRGASTDICGGCAVDPATGVAAYQRGGLNWVAEQGPATVTVARAWQPHVVAQQIPQTTYVQRIVTRKVPIQVARLVNEEQVRRVPVQ